VRSDIRELRLQGSRSQPRIMAATDRDESGRIRTQLVSQHDVVISSQVEGKIAQLPLKDGDAFKRGELFGGFRL